MAATKLIREIAISHNINNPAKFKMATTKNLAQKLWLPKKSQYPSRILS